MPAIDTVALYSTQAAAAAFPVALAPAPGDSLTVRNFAPSDMAEMAALIYSAGGAQKVRVTSPMLHDNVTGITLAPADVPSEWGMPPEAVLRLTPGDTLAVYGGIAAAGTIVAGLVNYYTNLPGAAARLHSWGDIKGLIKYTKMVEIDVAAVAVGAWTDTLITNTENQLHAHSDYAVLGYQCPAAIDIVGVKGQATGNLRVCGSGVTGTLDQTDYFITQSNLQGMPYIPVFNADDRGAFYVSCFNHAAIAAGAASVYLVLAELTQTVTP